MRSRFLLLIFFLPFFLHAQKKLGHAPFFKSFNAKKLAHALTDGLDNDSLKVRSLYLWETRHIRYDVRAFQKGRPSYVKPRKILFHRKAVCLGYSILFDSLCHYAGISSDMVIGHAYTEWYEARDTLFLSNHAWDVVSVNGNWKLIDVTWASGSIKPRLQLIRRLLSRIGVPFRQKYRYHRHRNDFYFETAPERFVENHLPSTPAWQLLPCSVPVDSFQMSPTATMHFLRGTPDTCKDGNDSIPAITAEPKNRHEVIMGKQAVGFNKNNHHDIAIGYMYYSDDLLKQADNKKQSRMARIVLYDSTSHQMDSAAKYFNMAAVNAREELKFFQERNKRMRKQVQDENKPLIARQKLYLSQLEKEKNYGKSECRKLKAENRRLRKSSRRFNRKRLRTHRPDNPKPGEVQLTKILMSSIDSGDAQVKIISDSTRMLVFNNREIVHYDSCMVMKKQILHHQVKVQKVIVAMRKFSFINSYDTVMINTKRIVFTSEQKTDSLDKIIIHEKEWLVKKNNRHYAKEVKAMDQVFTANLKICKQLARMSETSFSEDSVFDAQQELYQNWNDSLINENTQLIKAYRDYIHHLKKLKKYHRRALKRYRKELSAEDMRVAGTNAFFKKYFGGYARVLKHDARVYKHNKSYCKSRRNKLQKEENKANKKSGVK